MSTLTAADENGSLGDLQVGDWRVSPRRNELQRDGKSVRLEPKAIEVLAHLARHAGEVVGREELLAAVWPGVVVGDDALTQAIIKLRKALEDDAHRPKYIETISKRGYRLIALVAKSEGPRIPAAGVRRSFFHRSRVLLGIAGALLVFLMGALVAFPEIARTIGMPWPLAPDPRGAPTVSLPTVAVLPLSNLSGDAKRDYFSDGLTEDIIGALGRFSGVRVISSNAVRGLEDGSRSPQAIRSELGARYIVQGSVREADGKLRVAVELSDADRGVLLWSERYDGEGTQLFEIQDRIVKNIVGRLHVKLTQLEKQRVFSKPTDSLAAYDLVLRARSLLDRADRGANLEARVLLARAQKLAPDYAEIYSNLSDAEYHRVVFGWIEDAAEGARRAEEFAKRALSLPDLQAHSRAHSSLAALYTVQGRFEEALEHAGRAIELNPSDSEALFRRGQALLYAGRIDEAIASLETARRFDPIARPGHIVHLVIAYYLASRYRESLALVDAFISRYPRFAVLHAARAATLSQLGRLQEATEEADQVRRFNPFFRHEDFGSRFANPEHTARIRDGLRQAGL